MNLNWQQLRAIIGSCVGLTEYRARCQIGPLMPFASIEDDIGEDDLDEIAARFSRAFGVKGLPRPAMQQLIDTWMQAAERSLAANGVDVKTANLRLAAYYDLHGGEYYLIEG